MLGRGDIIKSNYFLEMIDGNDGDNYYPIVSLQLKGSERRASFDHGYVKPDDVKREDGVFTWVENEPEEIDLLDLEDIEDWDEEDINDL